MEVTSNILSETHYLLNKNNDDKQSACTKYYQNGGPGESLMKLWIERVANKNIHQGHRLEALETVWSLTHNKQLIPFLFERNVVSAIFTILDEFLYDPSCKTEIDADCFSVIDNMSLSCFIEQEKIRSVAFLVLFNLIQLDDYCVGKVMEKLIDDSMLLIRQKIIFFCKKYMEIDCDNYHSYINSSYNEMEVNSEIFKPENLGKSSQIMLQGILSSMKTKKEQEINEIEILLQNYKTKMENSNKNKKKSFIRSTRITIY